MTTRHDHPDLPRAEPEFRALRLGFALNSLAAELVAERRKVAQLRKELRQLKARLEAAGANSCQRGDAVPADGREDGDR